MIYSRLHANYRPSAVQLLEDYPSVIDWCPFPILRDKLILLHSANPYLDQIICDIATAYVVEVDADKFVLGQLGRAYIRVWDLICGFEPDDIENDPVQSSDLDREQLLGPELAQGHLPFSLPAPNVETLFQPPYTRRAFKSLGFDDGVPRFKETRVFLFSTQNYTILVQKSWPPALPSYQRFRRKYHVRIYQDMRLWPSIGTLQIGVSTPYADHHS